MQTLIKNSIPELIDTIKVQNGFIGYSNFSEPNSGNMCTIMPNRILVIYKDYIAIDNFDRFCSFTLKFSPQNNILLFRVFRIENPGNVFAYYIPGYTYDLYEYVPLVNKLNSLNPNESFCFDNQEFDFLEISILINRILNSHQFTYVSSSDLFPVNILQQYLSQENLKEIQNSNTQFLLSHTKEFEDVSSPLNNKSKKVIAEYVSKEHINIPLENKWMSSLPKNVSLVDE